MIIATLSFLKNFLSSSNSFLSRQKRKAGVLKFSRFKERFRKDSGFRDGLVWRVGLLVRSEKKWKSEPINARLVKPLIAKLLYIPFSILKVKLITTSNLTVLFS